MCSSLQTFIELPPFPRKVIGKAKATEGIKRVLELAREIGVQIKLRLREEPEAKDVSPRGGGRGRGGLNGI